MSNTPRTDALQEKWRYATNAGGNLDEALDDMFNEHGQLEQELAEARKDTERLDWLFRNARIETRPPCEWDDGKQLIDRQAIDNATKGGER